MLRLYTNLTRQGSGDCLGCDWPSLVKCVLDATWWRSAQVNFHNKILSTWLEKNRIADCQCSKFFCSVNFCLIYNKFDELQLVYFCLYRLKQKRCYMRYALKAQFQCDIIRDTIVIDNFIYAAALENRLQHRLMTINSHWHTLQMRNAKELTAGGHVERKSWWCHEGRKCHHPVSRWIFPAIFAQVLHQFVAQSSIACKFRGRSTTTLIFNLLWSGELSKTFEKGTICHLWFSSHCQALQAPQNHARLISFLILCANIWQRFWIYLWSPVEPIAILPQQLVISIWLINHSQ